MPHIDFDEDKQNRRVDDLRKQEEEELGTAMAAKFGLPYTDLSVTPINIDSLRYVSELEAREAELAVYNSVDKELYIAILSPNNEHAQEIIARLEAKGLHVNLSMTSHQSLNRVWDRYKDMSFSFETKSGALDISNEQITDFLGQVRSLTDITTLIKETLAMKKGYRISRILEIIIAGAIATGASDVHLEPEESYVRLRYRLDGVLTDILDFDTETFKLLLSRIKLISSLKLNVNDAQDGRFSIKLDNSEIEVRTSLLPGAYDASIVLRILNPKAISVPLEDLGIHPRLLKILLHEISKPNGMILNTGPTGSGKTTTLYAFLQKVYSPELKIITIEDPIEYHLDGITQTQVDHKKGYTFLEGLRSALRQDPDIIMVGEIRDSETAKIGVESALTGHIVFSTLHTNNASGVIPRLIDLDVNPKILVSALSLSIAQRLVRKLCTNCKHERPITEPEKKTVEMIWNNAVANGKNMEQFGVKKETATVWSAAGCEKCGNTGYKGRLGIFEVVQMDANIEHIILENPTERDIKKIADKQGTLDMREDGIVKILQGITDFAEVQSVVDLSEQK